MSHVEIKGCSWEKWIKVKSQSHIATDSQSVSQSVSLGVEPRLGLTTRYLLLFASYGLLFVGRPLSREDGVCLLYMLLALASAVFLLGLATIFYCLSFETSLFVASYDSQGHGGGIGTRLHAGEWIKMVGSGQRTNRLAGRNNRYSNRETVFSVRSVPRCYKQDN
jgi:hypothetical protein